MLENQTGRTIKQMQSDNGREYLSNEFKQFLKENGIQQRLSIPYNPEQNGTAERKNRTLVEMARCLLLQSGLSPSFWAEAVSTANYIRNCCPTKSLHGRTPFESWTGSIPEVNHFREFGCNVLCLNRVPGKGKLDDRTRRGIFLGYASDAKGYRIWLPVENKIEVSRDVKFLKDSENMSFDGFEDFAPDNPTGQKRSDSDDFDIKENEVEMEIKPIEQYPPLDDNQDMISDEEISDQEAMEETPQKRGRGRPRFLRTGLRGRPKKLFSASREEAELACFESSSIAEVPIKKALADSDADDWHRAMAAEVASILKNDTWDLVERPNDREIIGSRFVLRNKFRPDGTLERRKARIVAQGFAQRPGIHFRRSHP